MSDFSEERGREAVGQSDWELLRAALREAGIDPSDLGRFVNDTRHFDPPAFDERAAMPVLIEVLPRLSNPSVVETVAAHLSRPWAKQAAFEALLEAFRRWALVESTAGWQLGGALARVSDEARVDVLLELAADKRFGYSRQEIVDSLWRFRKDDRVLSLLMELLHDDDVSLHAASALQRTLGRQEAGQIFSSLLEQDVSPRLREVASRQLKRIQRAEQRALRKPK